MTGKLHRWLGSLFLAGALALPVHAQAPAAPATERRPPVPEYAAAILATLLVLVIVCAPSRKP